MPEPLVSEQPADTFSYRPLSGLAIAALVIAAGYAIIVGGVGIVAFVSGTPVILPEWTFVFPVVSLVLAVIARRQIRTAEGTRSGLALASWAWWLSILFGVGYAAIYVGTLVAVWWQADTYTQENFFNKIRAGKVDEAFLFTMDPEDRARSSRIQEIRERFGQPVGGKKSPLAAFQENEIVQFIRRGGSETKIKSLGLKHWEYKDRGYTVQQNYRITTPEGVYDVGLTVRSREGPEFKGRRWQLTFGQSGTFIASKLQTAYGKKINDWRQYAQVFGAQWMSQYKQGDVVGVFLGTREPQERVRLGRQYLLNQLAGSLGAAGGLTSLGSPAIAAASFLPLLDQQLACRLYLPGFNQFAAGDLVDAQDFDAPKKVKTVMLERVKESLLSPKAVFIRPHDDQGILERSETEPHHLQVNFNVEVGIFEDDPANPKYRGQAALVLESDQDPMTSDAVPQWRVVKLKLFAAVTTQSGAGPGATQAR